jgi:hypothetical protein
MHRQWAARPGQASGNRPVPANHLLPDLTSLAPGSRFPPSRICQKNMIGRSVHNASYKRSRYKAGAFVAVKFTYHAQPRRGMPETLSTTLE